MNGCINQHNCRIWGSEQPNEIHEYVRGSAKVNVWCGLLCDCVVGPFFFAESTITGGIYQICLKIIFSHKLKKTWTQKLGICSFSCRTEHLLIFASLCIKPWIRSSPMPGLGGADQSSGLPEAQILPRWTLFFCGDTSRTLCMVKRFGISGTYRIVSQQPLCNGNSRYDSVDLAWDRILPRYLPSDKWSTYRNILR
jgi:hypothetical protein